jgi:hypothetical protein
LISFLDFLDSAPEEHNEENAAIHKRRLEFIVAMHDFIQCKGVEEFYQSFSGFLFNPSIDWNNEEHILELISPSSEVYVLLDKNIMTYIKAMLEGSSNDLKRDRELAGMLWFFAFGCNAKFDCNTASLEYYMSSQQQADPFNLMIERQALEDILNTVWNDPMQLLEFSLGTIDKLKPIPLLNDQHYRTNEKLPEKFDLFYIASLKLFLLQKDQALGDLEKIIAFMKWQLDEFLILASAVEFASLQFSGKIKQHSKFKKATTYEAAISYCKGMAWDLYYTWDYCKTANRPNEIWFFASGDKVLLRVFREVFTDEERDSEEKLRKLFSSHWGSRGASVFAHHKRMQEEAERRGDTRLPTQDKINAQREALEESIRALMAA